MVTRVPPETGPNEGQMTLTENIKKQPITDHVVDSNIRYKSGVFLTSAQMISFCNRKLKFLAKRVNFNSNILTGLIEFYTNVIVCVVKTARRDNVQ